MTEIKVESGKRPANEDGSKAFVLIPAPAVLEAETLDSLIELVGAEMVFAKAKAQILIDFRSHVRSQMESEVDGDFRTSLEEVQAYDYTDWKPSTRTRKTDLEKAKEVFGKLDPEVARALLAELEGEDADATE